MSIGCVSTLGGALNGFRAERDSSGCSLFACFTTHRRMQYSGAMSDPHEIWQFGRWIGRQEGGAARLTWADGELILRIHKGRGRFVEGVDSVELSQRLSCQPVGSHDLLEEARSLSKDGQIAETHAMGAAKELTQESLRAWLECPWQRPAGIGCTAE